MWVGFFFPLTLCLQFKLGAQEEITGKKPKMWKRKCSKECELHGLFNRVLALQPCPDMDPSVSPQLAFLHPGEHKDRICVLATVHTHIPVLCAHKRRPPPSPPPPSHFALTPKRWPTFLCTVKKCKHSDFLHLRTQEELKHKVCRCLSLSELCSTCCRLNRLIPCACWLCEFVKFLLLDLFYLQYSDTETKRRRRKVREGKKLSTGTSLDCNFLRPLLSQSFFYETSPQRLV